MSGAGHEEETCRICLESSPIATNSFSKLSESLILEEDRLISPCACSGTQAFVHFKCLRRWQRAVISSRRPGASQAPAIVCSVCTQRFSIAPPRPAISYQLWKAVTGYTCEFAGLLVILCACYVALTGYDLRSMLEELQTGLAIAREVLPCSFFVNVDERCLSRTCSMRNDPVSALQSNACDHVKHFDGGEAYCKINSLLGSRLRFGWANLHPGTLLVATHAMPSPFFFGTVILLYEHQRCSGSRGLILNRDVERKTVLQWEKEVLDNGMAFTGLAHGMGGPVAQDEWSILHRCAQCKEAKGVDKKTCTRLWGFEVLPGVYVGKDLVPVLRSNCSDKSRTCTQDCSDGPLASSLHKTLRSRGNNRRSHARGLKPRKSEMLPNSHQVLHGHAEWYVGQLGREVRRGLWVTKENASELVLSTPPHELWHALLHE